MNVDSSATEGGQGDPPVSPPNDRYERIIQNQRKEIAELRNRLSEYLDQEERFGKLEQLLTESYRKATDYQNRMHESLEAKDLEIDSLKESLDALRSEEDAKNQKIEEYRQQVRSQSDLLMDAEKELGNKEGMMMVMIEEVLLLDNIF